MADHPETITVDDKASQTHGIKVKMRYDDNSKRYAWCIVDKTKQVHVFERDIYWDFDKGSRETQLWLHDGWLAAHSIKLPLITKL